MKNIDKNDLEILKIIRDEYIQHHEDLTSIENELIELSNRRKEISEKLNNLRLNESGVINKIEKQNNIKLTADSLMELLKNED